MDAEGKVRTPAVIAIRKWVSKNSADVDTGHSKIFQEIMFAFVLLVLCGVDKVWSINHEVWRSTSMIKVACDQEAKYQETGQFPDPIKDQQPKDYCGWFSKGKPRGDACADIRVHFSSCGNKSIARQGSVRVINGTDARRAFPSIANFFTCSGSVLNNEWLITAGHCVCKGSVPIPKRILGLYDLQNKTNPFKILVNKTKDVCLENYKLGDPQVDFALSKVVKFEYNDGVQPIRMPPSGDFRYMGPAYFVGYGSTGDTKPKFLQEVTLPVISTDVCIELFDENNITDEVNVCAGYFDSGKRTCNGDSGGPLFICQNYQLVQYAVLIGGTANCGDTPRLFMRLTHFADFISRTIQNE